MTTVTRFLLLALTMAGLAVGTSGCVSIGSTLGVGDSAPVGEPPRAEGPIPPEFTRFVESLWPSAQAAGVSRGVFDAAFAGVGPDQDVLDKASYQPEFTKEIWEYLDGAVSDTRVSTGREMLAANRGLLDQIEARYGVSRHTVVAIWGMESSYGKVLGNPRVVKNVVRALSTLAWQGGRRAKFGRQQLIAVLKILQSGDTDPRHITGSWAGAMGHTQFIPTTYLAYAVDFDGDGRRHLWTSIPDALASTANYLQKSGWRSGQTWGYEVSLPAGFDTGRAGSRKSIGEWRALGVGRVNGAPFPRDGDTAKLFLPAGTRGPAFLTLHNFDVIKRYNNADSYALGVGHLGDRLMGGGPFVASWPRTYQPLDEAGRQELQVLLTRKGFDTNGTDGTIGPATLGAIRSYQQVVGLEPDGNPSQELLQHLRR